MQNQILEYILIIAVILGSEMDNLDELTAFILDQRTKASTKGQYARKVKHFSTWMASHYPDHVGDDGEVNYQDVSGREYVTFFTAMSKKTEGSASKKKGDYHTFEHVSGYKSAIKDDIKKKRIKLSDEVEAHMSEYFQSYKNLIAQQKMDGHMELQEGRAPFSFAAYCYLAQYSLQGSTTPQHIFAHTFLVFCWNLLARCTSVANLNYNHITWKDDAMVIVFPAHKGNE
jgi:hypothetical protein